MPASLTRVRLSPDRIARAGLAIVDEQGQAALTMRAVGERLGVTAMALYHHVPTKDDLLQLVVDAAVDERPLPAPTGRGWEADLVDLANWIRDGLLAHPGLVPVTTAVRQWTPAVARVSERWLTIWERAGFEFDDAVQLASISSTAIVGYTEREIAMRRLAPPERDDLHHLPTLRAAIESERTHNPQDNFDLFVGALIDGLCGARRNNGDRA